MTHTSTITLPDGEQLARHTAEWLADRAAASEGVFNLCLSGGSTPKRMFEILAEPLLRDRFPWSRTHFFWGDERFVPPDHADSNYRMTRLALLDHVPVPLANVHRIPTDGEPEDAASRYEQTLKAHYGADTLDPARPLFDITFLGLGEDGHTASLFPGVAALEERARWVVAVIGAKPEPRISLTYPALDSSATVAFLVAGHAKQDILRQARSGDHALPAARVAPVGDLLWLTDAAAMS